ncbi:glutamate receptor U1-like isoform X2 [Bradysia coprophila]|uniref:glutamate receptor U1-like isoform X2 n=1 Tax=Bradysia coprophila TaxID=38358 RepID=UPI00187DCE4A|nr:glutamate receptor U1-like isoform X2 [Bradysia coprophila]
MKIQAVACVVLTLLKFTSSSNFNFPLITQYLQWHNIRATLFVACGRTDWVELQDITNNMKIHDIYFNHWDLSGGDDVADFNYQHFFVRVNYPICVVVQWECNETMRMLTEISKRTMFHYERHWLMFGKSSEKMFSTLSGEYINVDAEVVVAEAIAKNEYQLSDVYNPSVKRNGTFKMGRIGNWNEISGLIMNESNTKFDRRHNLEGLTFFAAITIPALPPNKTFIEHIYSDEPRYLYMDNMSKSNMRVFQILSEMYNFKMTIRRATLWGRIQNNSWNGVLGLLNRSEIDMGISGLRWESDRYGVYEPTTNSFYVQILFIFRHPKIVDALDIFIKPFVWMVWLLIFAIAVITSILIRNFFVLENRLSARSAAIATTSNDDSYFNSVLSMFGILFQQGCTDNPSFISTRIFTLTYFLFSLVIFQFYGSFIVSSLLNEAPKTIKTMKQLLHTRLDFAMDELPYIQDVFSHVFEESALEMYNKIMEQPIPFLPLFTGLDLVKKGSLAFNTDGIAAYAILKTSLTDDELCELQQVKYVGKIPTSPGVPKRSPLRELIKIGIRKLHESGIIAHVWKTWISHLPKCARSDVDVVPVDMIHFSSALYVLGFGMQLSMTLFIGELCRNVYLRLRNIPITPKVNR